MITTTSLIAPVGRIEPEMFPGDTPAMLQQRVAAYLVDAQTKPEVMVLDPESVNFAIQAWVYHRAFDAASVLMDSKAATVSLADQGSKSFLHEQIKQQRDRAQYWLDQFLELTVGDIRLRAPIRGTIAVRNTYV